MLLHEPWYTNVLIRPDKVAIKCDGQTVTYRQLHDRAIRLACHLTAHGLKKGDRVAIWMDNSIEACISIYAALLAGGVFVAINPGSKADKLIFILNDCQARFLLTQADRHSNFAGLLQQAPGLVELILEPAWTTNHPQFASWTDVTTGSPGETTLPAVIDVDLAAFIYTSGSTGNPKGVMMTHHNMHSAARSIISYLENTPDDVVINVLPLSFDYGLYQFLMVMTFGGTLVLEKDFTYPAMLVQRLLQEHVSGFPGVPTVFGMLFKYRTMASMKFPNLRYISNTGAALPEEFIQRLRTLFPGVRIYSMYGLTECKRVAFLPPDEIARKPNSVGHAMPNTEVYIVDEDDQPVGPNQIGELIVRGSNVMQGYWNLPEETDRVLCRGRHPYERALRTGDLFKTDQDGYLYYIGRKDDIIKSRVEKVSPKEVENVLYRMEGIEEAVVFGEADTLLGQTVRAVVKRGLSCTLTDKEIIRFCSAHLESFCVPKTVTFVEEMPKNANGKIDKKQMIASLSIEVRHEPITI